MLVSPFIELVYVASFSIIIGSQKLSRTFCKHILNLKVSLKMNFNPFSSKAKIPLAGIFLHYKGGSLGRNTLNGTWPYHQAATVWIWWSC